MHGLQIGNDWNDERWAAHWAEVDRREWLDTIERYEATLDRYRTQEFWGEHRVHLIETTEKCVQELRDRGGPRPRQYIRLNHCVPRHIYAINSRNLSWGVYDGDSGFIGIREKFDYLYLFTEFHHDAGPPFGTVSPHADVGTLPSGIILTERINNHDNHDLFDHLALVEYTHDWADVIEPFYPDVSRRHREYLESMRKWREEDQAKEK